MKKKFLNCIILSLVIVSTLIGCGQKNDSNIQDNVVLETEPSNDVMTEINNNFTDVTEFEVCFGDEGEPFIMHLYNNDTVSAIASFIDTNGIRLPIYHYDDYENYEVMQYYDIPTRYEIPFEPETITSEKAGEVYFAEPNRIVLFYKDAEIKGEYTKIGYFDYSEEFVSAVENNPILEGWGNKIVLIRKGK